MFDVNAALSRRAKLREQATALNTLPTKQNREMTEGELSEYNSLIAELKTINAGLDTHAAGAHFPGQRKALLPSQYEGLDFNGLTQDENQDKTATAMEAISAFLRTGKILQSDTPLHYIESPVSGGLAAAIPTEVLNSLAAYFRNDAFALAGATIYQTDNTTPLVKPLVSAGSDFDTFNEGQSATDSHPMEVDSFTLAAPSIPGS